jgi:hypothetical protein
MELQIPLPPSQQLAIFPVLGQIHQVDAFNGLFFEV